MTALDSVWRILPGDLDLAQDEVHVWRAELDVSPAALRSLQSTLSADEWARAERFHFSQHRRRFIATHGLLRTILSRYLQVEPSRVCFLYGPRGKPALCTVALQHKILADTAGSSQCLEFNLSHAGGLALFAFAVDRRVGVDLERIRGNLDGKRIAERFFSPREQALLESLPAHLQNVAFFACWTRKEAYIKARGDGLALSLDRFDVSLPPDNPANLRHTVFDPDEATHWSVQELQPGREYTASLAVEGHDWRLVCWQWSHEAPWRQSTRSTRGSQYTRKHICLPEGA